MIRKINSFIRREHSKKERTESISRIRSSIDTPTDEHLTDRKIRLEGWAVSETGALLKAVRVWDGIGYITDYKTVERPDIIAAFPNIPAKAASGSGFLFEFEYKDQDVLVEADFGDGFEQIKHLRFSLDQDIASANYNPFLPTNWADHMDLLETKQIYYHETEGRSVVKRDDKAPKVVALYLPQFHPIPENDKAWGRGFTEWTNVAAAKPRFVGHRQPMQPADFGYYDLRVDDVMKQQIELAKNQGIYGFCFYYYWFSGKKALEMPLETMLRHKEWDHNFMICWANENWTKRWDGRDEDVILEQKYRKDDPLEFIKDVEDILLDPRYIRIDGKPALMVYRPEKLESKRYSKVWREYFKENHGLDLHLITVWGSVTDTPDIHGFDAAMQFIPGAIGARRDFAKKYHVSNENINGKLIDIRQSSTVINYRKVARDLVAELSQEKQRGFPLYKCVIPSWDNDARKKGQGATVFHYENPDLYYRWLKGTLAAQTKKQNITFVNAWNEWAEGAVLEPTSHYGHAVINRTGDAIAGRIPTFQGMVRSKDAQVAAVLQVESIENLRHHSDLLSQAAKFGIDVYITLDKTDEYLEEEVKKIIPKAQITAVPSRGGCALPFLFLLGRAEMLGYSSVARLVIGEEFKAKASFLESIETMQSVEKLTRSKSSGLLKEVRDNDSSGAIGEDEHTKMRHLAEIIWQDIYKKTEVEPKALTVDSKAFCVNISALRAMAEYHFMPEDFPADLVYSHQQVEGAIELCLQRTLQQFVTKKYTIKNNQLHKSH